MASLFHAELWTPQLRNDYEFTPCGVFYPNSDSRLTVTQTSPLRLANLGRKQCN